MCLLKLTGGYCRCNICHDFEICKDSSRFLPFLEHLIWLDQFRSIFFFMGLLGRFKKNNLHLEFMDIILELLPNLEDSFEIFEIFLNVFHLKLLEMKWDHDTI